MANETAVDILSGQFGVRWISASVVEDKKAKNEDDLVEELTPSLHQEGHGDISTTVKTISSG